MGVCNTKLWYLLLVLFCSSCYEDLNRPENKGDKFDFQVSLNVNKNLSAIDLDGFYVELKNEKQSYKSPVKNNKAQFQGVDRGDYDVSFHIPQLSADQCLNYLGVYQDYSLSGHIINFRVDEDVSDEASLYVDGFHSDSLLIKAFYATGSGHFVNQDHFITLFNNSDVPVDIAGLYIGVTAIGEQDAQLDNDLCLSSLIQIPNESAQILEARSSYTIAANAEIFSFINKNGIDQLDVDLSKADLEVYGGNYRMQKGISKDNPSDRDNLNVKNANILFLNTDHWHLYPEGSAIILFAADETLLFNQVDDKHALSDNIRVPYSTIKLIDGVDYLGCCNDKTTKMINPYVDWGFTQVPLNHSAALAHSRYRFMRKKLSKGDEALQLMDTNDSSDDFLASQPILLKK